MAPPPTSRAPCTGCTTWLGWSTRGAVAIDSRRPRPSKLSRLVNSTPLGTVLNERTLHRHRSRAGFRVGNGRHVDLFRYAAWLDDSYLPWHLEAMAAVFQAGYQWSLPAEVGSGGRKCQDLARLPIRVWLGPER